MRRLAVLFLAFAAAAAVPIPASQDLKEPHLTVGDCVTDVQLPRFTQTQNSEYSSADSRLELVRPAEDLTPEGVEVGEILPQTL